MIRSRFVLILFFYIIGHASFAQDTDNGAWYIYIWNTSFKDSKFGLQGDAQWRNWNMGGDLEQLLLRAGFNYQAHKDARFTLGYANITSGTPGESDATTTENRIYQEILLWQNITSRFQLNHRFRFEQRFVEDQITRTRFRYFLSLNIPLNTESIEKGTYYLSFYDEIFINGQRDIGDDGRVEYFDQNRLYAALGYAVQKNFKIQLGYMNRTVNGGDRSQWQIGAIHTF